jgi:hypothetical protein
MNENPFYTPVTRADGSEDYNFFMSEDLFAALLICICLMVGFSAGSFIGALAPKPHRAYIPGEPGSRFSNF